MPVEAPESTSTSISKASRTAATSSLVFAWSEHLRPSIQLQHILHYFPHNQQNEMKPELTESYRIHPLSIIFHHLQHFNHFPLFSTLIILVPQWLAPTFSNRTPGSTPATGVPAAVQSFQAAGSASPGTPALGTAMKSATSRGANIEIVNIQDGLLPLV